MPQTKLSDSKVQTMPCETCLDAALCDGTGACPPRGIPSGDLFALDRINEAKGFEMPCPYCGHTPCSRVHADCLSL